MIEEAMFIHSVLGKTIEKQTKTIDDQRNKQVEVLKVLKAAEEQEKRSIDDRYTIGQINNEIKKEINRIKTV